MLTRSRRLAGHHKMMETTQLIQIDTIILKLRDFYETCGERFLGVSPPDLYELQRELQQLPGFPRGRPGPGGGADATPDSVTTMMFSVFAFWVHRALFAIFMVTLFASFFRVVGITALESRSNFRDFRGNLISVAGNIFILMLPFYRFVVFCSDRLAVFCGGFVEL